MTDDILLQVMKPARYIGGEWNVSAKDFSAANIRFALCFPDLYELGMSNLGVRILYGILNNMEGVCCERFFACAKDMQERLRRNQREIFSLESQKPLREFDLVGFSLGYELCYTNVLGMLALGSIPLEAVGRDNQYPLIIGGGPCALNPEPMADFFDLFVIGEGEEAVKEIIDISRTHKDAFKSGRLSKHDLLMLMAGIEGVYAPSLYEVTYDDSGKISAFTPRHKGVTSRVRKRIVKDFENSYFPVSWLVPYLQITHDRVTIELMRGCPNTCRFCQARAQYYPLRQKSVGRVFALAKDCYRATGYEEISLTGLSISDYSGIEELLNFMIPYFKKEGIAVSLPSIKPKNMLGDLAQLIASIKKTGLTFAPEAGSERLRAVLGKDFDGAAFCKALEQAYLHGYQHVKLYFMIGLPCETNADLDAIIDFSMEASFLRKKVNKGPAQVRISINTLIPKPHTALQWCQMAGLEAIREKQDYLRSRIRNKKIHMDAHDRYLSILEGVFSRGDRRLGRVILNAFNNGALFDAWSDSFRYELWEQAFKQAQLEPSFYLQSRHQLDILPWDFIDVGIDREFLWQDFNKTIAMK